MSQSHEGFRGSIAELLGYDKTVEQFDLEGRSLFDLPSENPALLAVARTYDEALKA